MTSTMAIATAASSLLHSKPPPPPPTLLSHSPQSAQQLHLPKTTSSKWTPLVLTTSHSTLEKTMPTTSRSTNFPDLSFLSSLITSAIDNLAMVSPSLAYANTLYFKFGFNVQINVKENEPEESILFRFKKAVIRARVLQECRRRRFFESTQDKKKRKTRDAARRNSQRLEFVLSFLSFFRSVLVLVLVFIYFVATFGLIVQFG
jgi:ribosomal protein S21